MFERLEGAKVTPADIPVSIALEKFDAEGVHQVWLKAMERRETDPQGAITSARTLLGLSANTSSMKPANLMTRTPISWLVQNHIEKAEYRTEPTLGIDL
jgi:hypothetical protein